MPNGDFKDRVKNTVISQATAYKENFVDYKYLVCSEAFMVEPYYICSNRQHLNAFS